MNNIKMNKLSNALEKSLLILVKSIKIDCIFKHDMKLI